MGIDLADGCTQERAADVVGVILSRMSLAAQTSREIQCDDGLMDVMIEVFVGSVDPLDLSMAPEMSQILVAVLIRARPVDGSAVGLLMPCCGSCIERIVPSIAGKTSELLGGEASRFVIGSLLSFWGSAMIAVLESARGVVPHGETVH